MSEQENVDTSVEEVGSKLVETDGDLAVIVESEEEPEVDPTGESTDDNSGAEETVTDEDQKYAGKTREELIAMNDESTKYGSEKAQEASKYRQIKDSISSRADVKSDVITAEELKGAVKEQMKKVHSIDEVLEPEERQKAQLELDEMKLDLQEKREAERYDTLVDGEFNRDFLKDHQKVLKDGGFDIPNEEYVEDLVIDNEPRVALFGGEDGLDFYKEIIKNAESILNDKYIIAFEHAFNKAKQLKKIIKKHIQDVEIIQKKDMQGKDRMTFIIKK